MIEILNKEGYIKGLWVFLALFIIFIIGNVIIGLYLVDFALYHELIDILIPIAVYLSIRKKPFISTLKLNKGLKKESILTIILLFLASFLLKYGINYFVLLTGVIDPSEVTMKVVEMVPNLFVFFVAVSVIPVFLEEFIIRGVTLNEFTDTSLWQGAIVTGLLFGMMHIDLGQLGYTTALGIIMAAIVITTGSLWGGILFHFLNNFLSFAVFAAIQLFEGVIPQELTNEIIATDGAQGLISDNIFVMLFQGGSAILALIGGIMLTYHLVKKLERVNEYENHCKTSWIKLFVNVPFILILCVYVAVNIILVG